MQILNFDNYYLNESVREAKDFLTSMINKQQYEETELTNPESGYNLIKNLLQKNSGYTGFFVRKYYEDPEKHMPPQTYVDTWVKPIYDMLIQVKQYNMSINLNQYRDKTLVELNDTLKQMLTSKNVPGLILNSSPATKPLHGILKKSNYQIIVAVKKDASIGWIPDADAVKHWGCPKWCIRATSTFLDSYAKSENHLQYIIIANDIFDDISTAASQGAQSEHNYVPVNTPANMSSSDMSYNAPWSHESRLGITTKPISDIRLDAIFSSTSSISFYKQDDNNSSISNDNLTRWLSPIKFETLDIAVRSILGVSRSQFDIDIDIKTFIDYIAYDFNSTSDYKNKISQLSKAYTAIKNNINSPILHDKVLSHIDSYIVDNPNSFEALHPFLLYVDNVSDSVFNMFNDYYVTNSKSLNVPYVVNVFQIYVEGNSRNYMKNEKINEFLKIHIGRNYMTSNLLDDFIKDKINRKKDFKTELLIAFSEISEPRSYSSVGTELSYSRITLLTVDNLRFYDKLYAEDIINREKWDEEAKFVTSMLINDHYISNEYSDIFVKSILDWHLNTYNKVDEVIDGTKTGKKVSVRVFKDSKEFYEYIISASKYSKYNVNEHNSCLRYALKRYIEEFNTSIEDYVLKL